MRTCLLIVTLFYTLCVAKAQEVRMLSLKQEHIAYATKNFYIADVVDDRKAKDSVGFFHKQGQKKIKLNFREGAAQSLKAFIARNVTQNRSKQAIVLHI